MLINTNLAEYPPEHASTIIGSRLAIDDVQLNEGDELPEERGLVCPQSRACSSPGLGTALSQPVGRDIGHLSHSDEIMYDIDTPHSQVLLMPASHPPAEM